MFSIKIRIMAKIRKFARAFAKINVIVRFREYPIKLLRAYPCLLANLFIF
jgi:hypothetical protein